MVFHPMTSSFAGVAHLCFGLASSWLMHPGVANSRHWAGGIERGLSPDTNIFGNRRNLEKHMSWPALRGDFSQGFRFSCSVQAFWADRLVLLVFAASQRGLILRMDELHFSPPKKTGNQIIPTG